MSGLGRYRAEHPVSQDLQSKTGLAESLHGQLAAWGRVGLISKLDIGCFRVLSSCQ